MKLLEFPLGRASGKYKAKIPSTAHILGVGISHRDDAPALLIQSDAEEGKSKILEREFVVISTHDQLPSDIADRMRSGPKRFIGTVSSADTPSWAVFLLPKSDQDMRS